MTASIYRPRWSRGYSIATSSIHVMSLLLPWIVTATIAITWRAEINQLHGDKINLGGRITTLDGHQGGSADPPITGGPIQGSSPGVPTCHGVGLSLCFTLNHLLWAHESMYLCFSIVE